MSSADEGQDDERLCPFSTQRADRLLLSLVEARATPLSEPLAWGATPLSETHVWRRSAREERDGPIADDV
jgi:hypothetical protein